MPDNAKMIEMHLLQYLEENKKSTCPLMENWCSILAYCLGYYGEITMEHILVVRELQRQGKIN